MIKYILSIENPTEVSINTDRHLHNILTQQILPSDISKELTKVFQIGFELYTEFRQKRVVKKTEKLSDTIHRIYLKTFTSTQPQHDKIKKTTVTQEKILFRLKN